MTSLKGVCPSRGGFNKMIRNGTDQVKTGMTHKTTFSHLQNRLNEYIIAKPTSFIAYEVSYKLKSAGLQSWAEKLIDQYRTSLGSCKYAPE